MPIFPSQIRLQTLLFSSHIKDLSSYEMATSNLPAAECLSESGLSRDQKANELASVEVQPANAADEQFRFGSPLIIPYLLENCAEFRRLSELRQIVSAVTPC